MIKDSLVTCKVELQIFTPKYRKQAIKLDFLY